MAIEEAAKPSPIPPYPEKPEYPTEIFYGVEIPECWKFQHSKPEYLTEMFHGVAVDGSCSCIPVQAQFVEDADGDEEGEDAYGDGFDNNPMSTGTRKRGSSTTDTTTSVAKKSKALLLNKAIQELQSDIKELQYDIKELQFGIKDANQNLHFRSNKAIKEKQEKEEVDQQIDRCLRMAMECGATEQSEEYFMATTLFEKEYNRKIFCKFNTAEGRFMWLKRWCQRSRG
ncbi:hypothetical protein BDA96_07G153900 [Sorghum bicolor]|uniref:Uncharacterized protein n=1 Tax=Sorghum bicolor TaxID=4558 RepID=A0A921QNG8_SORBI|nr:hypothetical protein BDA96_07G153900 [Sorghum bicolor]